jgi:hypothetical protein
MNSGEMKPGAEGAGWEVNIPGNEASRKIRTSEETKAFRRTKAFRGNEDVPGN